MQEHLPKAEATSFSLKNLPQEDKKKLVDAFAWLLQEDKKQNPALYKPITKTND
jgi:hypothetical protein